MRELERLLTARATVADALLGAPVVRIGYERDDDSIEVLGCILATSSSSQRVI